MNVKFWRVVEPSAVRFVVEPVTKFNILVNRFVVVAEVPVALMNVKF